MFSPEPRHRLFLQWLIFFSAITAALIFAWLRGGIHFVISSDPTRITMLLGLLFAIGLGHGARRTWRISRELNVLQDLKDGRSSQSADSIVSTYLEKRQGFGDEENPARLDEVLSERARGPQEMGWFLAGLLVKLGLLGTVIGFILMMGSVADLESLDISDAQDLIQRMTRGMGVALVTTLVGLVGSMILGFQYLLIDRGAERLVSGAYLVAHDRGSARGSAKP
jgi:hypothetical protein